MECIADSEKQSVYLTVLSNETYIPGVRALKRSLEQVKSKHDLVILIPKSQENKLSNDLSKSGLLDEHCRLLVKDDVIVKYPDDLKFKRHYWNNTFFKLSVVNCVEYEKIVLLDSDMLIVRNIDHLFSMPHYSAAVAGHCRYPEWVKLNSGLMVIEPSNELYQKLLDSIEPAMYRRFREGYNIGDQDVFQEAFVDWEKHSELLLPEIYNCFFTYMRDLADKEHISLSDIAVIHFAGKAKPWSKNACAIVKNIFNCTACIIHFRFYELNLFFRYLIYSLENS